MQKTPDGVIIFLATTTCVMLVLFTFIITIVYFYRKRQIEYLKGIEQLKLDHDKNVLRTQLEIQEETFQTISRDIHDNINLSLTLAKLNLNTLNFFDKERLSVQVNSSIDFVSRAIADLTDISRSINSDIIIEQGLISALQSEIEKLNRLNWFTIQFAVTGDAVFMDAQRELFVFRIVQEAFNNILKHAQAKNVMLHLHYDYSHINIIIVDDGIGFIKSSLTEINKVKKQTSGLRNMQKRAELLNGVWEIESNPGSGTIIKIYIPFISDEDLS